MVDFQYYLNNDWFKIGRFGEKQVKYINIALLGKNNIYKKIYKIINNFINNSFSISLSFSYRRNIFIFLYFLFDNLLLNKLPQVG